MADNQTMTEPVPGAMGAQPYRGGAPQEVSYEVFNSFAGTAPPTELSGIRKLQFKQVQWAIIKPALCTSYKVTFYRLVGRVTMQGGVPHTVVAPQWIADETETATESMTYLQSTRGDQLHMTIHTVLGGPAASDFTVLYKGCNE